MYVTHAEGEDEDTVPPEAQCPRGSVHVQTNILLRPIIPEIVSTTNKDGHRQDIDPHDHGEH